MSDPALAAARDQPQDDASGPAQTLSEMSVSPPRKPVRFLNRLAACGRAILLRVRRWSVPVDAISALWVTDGSANAAHEAATHERSLAAARAALDEKARTIALTSHELRTPLNGILGMSDLLTRTALSPEQATYVRAIATSATALVALVDDMLDVSRLEAGRWQLKPQPVAIEALVEEVIELLAPRAQAKGLELAAHMATQVPRYVSVDPDQLIRILMNLTGNAIKFTDIGGVAIEVSVESQTQTEVRLAIQVRDTGIGIAAADQRRIFGEYEQAAAGQSIRPAGSGLGLAISRAIARTMGGDITLESRASGGSTFALRVPLAIIAPATEPDRRFAGRQILLVSGKPIEPPLLMRRLFDLGASVQLARDDATALALLAVDNRIDAVLYDHDGSQDAATFLAALDRASPPVAIMITPLDRPALDRLRDGGARAHLVKPMRKGSLTKVIDALMSGEALSPGADPEMRMQQLDTRTAHGMKILVADDNDINLLLCRSMLQSLGHEVESVDDGEQAVTTAARALQDSRPFDVILMDLHMPVLDGFTAITAIRQAEGLQGHRALIVALTADVTAESASAAYEAGADMTMLKPLQQATLVKLLARGHAGERSADAAG